MYFGTEKRPRSTFWLAIVTLFFVAVCGQPVAAADSTVRVEIDAGVPVLIPNLPTDRMTIVTNSTLRLTGSARHLSQIRVYVDDVAAGVVSLSVGATSFSVDIPLTTGPHTIRLVGVSLLGSDTPIVTMQVIYTPAPDAAPGGASPSDKPAINIGAGEQLPAQATDTSSRAVVPEWLQNGLVAIDFARSDTRGGDAVMLCRFLLILAGLIMVVFAEPTRAFYRHVRYRLLGWRRRPLPVGVRRHSLFLLRLGGVLLIALVLWLL